MIEKFGVKSSKLYLSNDVDSISTILLQKKIIWFFPLRNLLQESETWFFTNESCPSLSLSWWIEWLWFWLGVFGEFATRVFKRLDLVRIRIVVHWLHRDGSNNFFWFHWRIHHNSLWDFILHEHKRSFTDFFGMDWMITSLRSCLSFSGVLTASLLQD